MTVDGKIASKTGDPELSDEEDWKEVHKLRSTMDAIMVGKGTILKDDPKLHIKYHQHDGYHRIVADSNLSIPLTSQVITFKPELYPTIICINENVGLEKIREYEEHGVTAIKAGTGERIDLKVALQKLFQLGIHSILLEGGGTLNWGFIKEDLVDEIRLTIAPWLVGGNQATSLVEGDGFEMMKEAPRFSLLGMDSRKDYVTLHYKRKR